MTTRPSAVLQPAVVLNAAVGQMVALVSAPAVHAVSAVLGPTVAPSVHLATRLVGATRAMSGTLRQPATASVGRAAMPEPAVARAVTPMTALVSAPAELVTTPAPPSM